MTPDLSRSRVILIGNGRFEDPGIDAIPVATSCVNEMYRLLTDERLCGWPAERVVRILDAPRSEVVRRVRDAAVGVTDVLFVYFVGHGQRTEEGRLALSTADSSSRWDLLTDTCLVDDRLAHLLRGPARTKLLILDCCQAELAGGAGFQGADDAPPIDPDSVEGLYQIFASKRDTRARFPPEAADGDLTYFTRAFIDVVREGIPGRPGELRLDEIFARVHDRLVEAGYPEPTDAGRRSARAFPFARNAAPPSTLAPDPDQEIARLRHELAEARAAAAEAAARGADAEARQAEQAALGRVDELQDRIDQLIAPPRGQTRRKVLLTLAGGAALAGLGYGVHRLDVAGRSSARPPSGPSRSSGPSTPSAGASPTPTQPVTTPNPTKAPGARWTFPIPRNMVVGFDAAAGVVTVGCFNDDPNHDGMRGCVVYGLDPTGGTPMWQKSLPGTNMFSMIVVDDVTIVGTGDIAGPGTAYGLDSRSGRQLWTRPGELPELYQGPGGVAYLDSSDNSQQYLTALTSGGTQLWRNSVSDYFDVLAATDSVLITSIGINGLSTLQVLDPGTGSRRWKSDPLLGDAYGVLSPEGDVFFAVIENLDRAGGTSAFRMSDGHVVWQAPAIGPSGMDIGPVGHGVVVVQEFAGPAGRGVYALDASTGAKRWTLPKFADVVTGAEAAAGDHLLCGVRSAAKQSGVVRAVKLADGTRAWESPVLGDAVGLPLVIGGTAYVGVHDLDSAGNPAGNNRLCALDVTSGAPRWTVPVSARGIRDVRLVGDTLYVAVQDGISGHTSAVTALGPIAPAA